MDFSVKAISTLRDEIDKLRRQRPASLLLQTHEAAHGAVMDALVVDTTAFVKRDFRGDIRNEEAAAALVSTLVRFLQYLYCRTLRDYLTDFQGFLADPLTYGHRRHKKYTYPLLELYVRDATFGGPDNKSEAAAGRPLPRYGFVTDPGMYETSVTCPQLYEGYLCRQLTALIHAHGPVIRLRRGPRIMPIHFAIEALKLGEISGIDIRDDQIDYEVNNKMPLHFDVPLLKDIDDVSKAREDEAVTVPSLEYLNDVYFSKTRPGWATDMADGTNNDTVIITEIAKRQAADNSSRMLSQRKYPISPLSLFDGDRVDYSLGRIWHYTKTSPSNFQNFIVFTNYQMYIDEFLKYASCYLLAQLVGEKEIVSTERLLAALRSRGLEVSLDKLRRRLADPISIVMPTYGRRTADSKAAELNPEWLLQQDRMLREEGKETEYDRKSKELRVPLSKLITAVEVACFKLFRKRDTRPIPDEDEKTFSTTVTAILNCFLDGRDRHGVLGPVAPQMPAYHLVKKDRSGITMVNIGVGPSNAKTITDHLAVLRPHLFLMLGHCAGLRSTQRLGHYVLADGYLRADSVLDAHSATDMPIPSIVQIHETILEAFEKVAGPEENGEDQLSPRFRRGPVATVMDRNWELRYPDESLPLEAAKCVGLDMESATIAANGFRYSVPYAAFLCVSDRPLHGDLKLEGMSDSFYRSAVGQHFQIAIKAVEKLCRKYVDGIGTRKLRGRSQPPFQ